MKESLELQALKQKLADKEGKVYWRSLDELADSEAFKEYLHKEFPEDASVWNDPISRRHFLKLMGASLAFAGLAACVRLPVTKIIPYVRTPKDRIPGKPIYFATAMTLGGFATGVLVESHDGRPTKVEGNPDHPASLGATDVFMQASILGLYDPDRSKTVLREGHISTWGSFNSDIAPQLDLQIAKQGAGLRVLTQTVTSPTMAAQMAAFLKKFPKAKWHAYEPVSRDSVKQGAQLAFGEICESVYRFKDAKVILSLDSDFLFRPHGRLRYARDFIDGRRVTGTNKAMNRLYVVESTATTTGAMADHRLPARASQIEAVAWDLAARLGVAAKSAATNPVPDRWMSALVKDLGQHRGQSVIIAGEDQPAAVHALVHAMNAALGNLGKTVIPTASAEVSPALQLNSLRELNDDMNSGAVEMLFILGGNPVFDAPSEFNFARSLKKVTTRVHLGAYFNETSALCGWHLPELHYLEAWGDARAFDGTISIQQPLIEPLYEGWTSLEVIDVLIQASNRKSHDIVRDHWQREKFFGLFDDFWRAALDKGVVEGSAFSEKRVTLKRDFAATLKPAAAVQGEFEIAFRPDPTVWDGSFVNNGWLQELPKPLTKLTWDNAALISPKTAARLGAVNGDLLELAVAGKKLSIAAWILPGQPDGVVTVNFGYGRRIAGRVGSHTGFNAFELRGSHAWLFATGLAVKKLFGTYALATTQHHSAVEGRDLVRVHDISAFNEKPEPREEAPTLYPDTPGLKESANAWAMSINLNSCIGCNACTIGCQSENNIPVVGKDQVLKSREMHWIRVDRYYSGEADNPEAVFQPMPCMHCEKAPCEVVCPVGATVHDDEGLNDMVYNRCVGTRYCSNNCPYKVRRFNFLQYSDLETPVLKMLQNPDVTVRSRGVMEKCTYCIQRITAARIEAEKQDRPIRDGEVVTACQQACPTGAIVFGNKHDPESQIAKLKSDPRDYGVLEDLGTRPRTTYLPRWRNLNPELA